MEVVGEEQAVRNHPQQVEANVIEKMANLEDRISEQLKEIDNLFVVEKANPKKETQEPERGPLAKGGLRQVNNQRSTSRTQEKKPTVQKK